MSGHPALAELRRRLLVQREAGLERKLTSIGPACGPWVTVRGRRCLLMASNDYLGLAGHPALALAAREALAQGCGSGASRLISGTLDGHRLLERDIAAFKGTEAALFLPTGFMTNLALISGLTAPGDLVLSDALNHASIVDACRLSRAGLRIYPHRDAAAAAAILAEERGPGLRLIVSDGVFSMDGDAAPLPELLAVAREHGALLLVDDAHATGVWGASGRGTAEHFGVTPGPELVLMGTFSKALGGLGGFVAGDRTIIDTLVQRARPFLYSTAPPPAQAAVAARALRLVDEEPERREHLRRLCARLREGMTAAGREPLSDSGPIVPLLVGDARQAVALAEALWQRGVFVPAVRPPTVPEGTSRLRFTLTAAHNEADVDAALNALNDAWREVMA